MSTTSVDIRGLAAQVKGERRTATAAIRWNAETRDGSLLTVSGHAAVFDSESEDLGFIETLAPGCFERALNRPGADPYLLLGHDRNAILARRSAGTLELHEDAQGLAFTANIVPTQQGKDVALLVKSGHLDGCSFGFTVAKDSWSERDGGAHRRVLEIGELLEITLTGNPAYSATSVRDLELTRRIERTAVSKRQLRSVTANPYAVAGKFSWFRDQWVAAEAKRTWQALFDAGHGPMLSPSGEIDSTVAPNTVHGGLLEARARLQQLGRHLRETRDLSTTLTAGGDFMVTPVHIAEAFAAAARARGVLPAVLPVHVLPTSGMTLRTPRMTTGVDTSPQQTENTSISEQNIVESAITSPVSTIAGFEDVSYQLLDRADPGIDVVLADELGRSLAQELDVLLLTGTGVVPNLLGLGSVSGITAVTYTDASPTVQELLPKIAEAASRVATALGTDPDVILWHPRREAWAHSNLGTTLSALRSALPYNLRTVSVANIGTTYGASTNEDLIYVCRADELPIYLGPVNFSVMSDIGSGTLTARIRAYQYCSALFQRRPEAIATVGGTGLVNWYA